jgi:cardiolipin synthase
VHSGRVVLLGWLPSWAPGWLVQWPPSWLLVTIVLLVLGDQVLRAIAIAVVPADRRPSSAWAWLLAIFFLPYLGVAAFLLIGSPKLPRARREKQRRINDLIMTRTTGMDLVSTEAPWPPWLASVARLNRHLGAMPLVESNSATLHTDYAASVLAMAEEVDRAREYVHAEFYILSSDATTAPFFDALGRAVARGVTVRVLLDHVASLRTPGYGATVRHLERLGAQWHPLLPVQPLKGHWQRPDLRNHRKLLVVDGVVAWTGSQNLVDRGYHKKRYARRGLQWQDLMARLEGPVVAEVNALFITDWYSETDELLGEERPVALPATSARALECQVVPSGPGFVGENNLKLFNALIYYAQERVVITSPYFVPDESLLYAITTAAERGLRVELFVSEIGDQWLVFHAQRSYYEALLRAGVRIFLYPAPYVLHAKHITIDDQVAVVGSSNMDMRSFSLNMEVSVLVHGEEFVQDLRRVEDGYRAAARELTLHEWLDRPFRARLLDNLARLTSALQ